MRYLIGIDLGTTNSALAYIDLRNKPTVGRLGLKTFPIPQLVGVGQIAERSLLPSFLYLPSEHDLPAGSTQLPWNPNNHEVIGEFARNHGAKIPGRLISSAKSWLSHTGVDRLAPLLPWNAPPEVNRLSPLEVSTRYLKHMVDAWNHSHAKNPQDFIENQSVTLTVPASFDDVARSLTLQAAQAAGLKNVVLLEEPQAAFYCWMGLSDPIEVGQVKPGMRCLVVDVGGGTTDFSLIQASEENGELSFIRESVGDHLLLGGDNMDLALAKAIEQKLPQAGRLDAAQFGMLVQACRNAKETLLGLKAPPSVTVTIPGRGRSVVGGSIHTQLTPEDIQQILFEGFFPKISRDSMPTQTRSGLQEMGLPYVADPAMTRHLAQFLGKQLKADEKPDAILFNGGVFQPQSLRERLIEVMKPWYGADWSPLILASPSLDLAVAWGAAYSGWLRHTGGKRIGGGIPRSYYIAVESGTNEKAQALCVLPRRAEEGEIVELKEPTLELAIGEPVLFPLFTSTVRGDDQAGQLIQLTGEKLGKLPPLFTVLRGGKRAGNKRVPVQLASKVTEIGTLELYCVAKEGENRWRLEFNVRDILTDEGANEEIDSTQQLVDVLPESQILQACELLERTFGNKTPSVSPQEITKALEGALESSRNSWSMSVCRRLWETLEGLIEGRTKSPQHLIRWYNLAGFLLRPGFGDSLDRYRVDQLWKTLNTLGKGGLEGGAELWILWRRVSGGLASSIQNTLMSRLRPILLPPKGKNLAKPPANEYAEMWRLAGSLERIDLKTKQQLGDALLHQTKRDPIPNYVYWSLSRIGARALFYGPLNLVLHPNLVTQWIEEMLERPPTQETDLKNWGFCVASLARRTGQRALDLDDEVRNRVIYTLEKFPQLPENYRQIVQEISPLQTSDQGQIFGESLPIGLRLSTKGG